MPKSDKKFSPNEPPKNATPEERDAWLKVPRQFVYRERLKPGKKSIVDTDPNFLDRVSACSGLHMTQRETAAVLCISQQHLSLLIGTDDRVREAWEDGRQKGKASLRMLLWRLAQEDPATARFLAKQKRYLNMTDGAEKAAQVAANAVDRERVSKEMAIQRVMELAAKLSLAKDRERAQTIEAEALPAPKKRAR